MQYDFDLYFRAEAPCMSTSFAERRIEAPRVYVQCTAQMDRDVAGLWDEKKKIDIESASWL